MAGSVGEQVPEACGCDHIPCCAIYLGYENPRSRPVACSCIGFIDDLRYLAQPGIGFAPGKYARQIREIAVHVRAPVNEDEVSLPEGLPGRHRVGIRRVRTEGYDGKKRQLGLAPSADQLNGKLLRQLRLRE